jgi:hypothetical protein
VERTGLEPTCRFQVRYGPPFTTTLGVMKYADLIERVLAEANRNLPLAELLGRVDALDKSVPTLEELNDALSQVKRSGRFPAQDCSPVTREAYDRAISENHEMAVQFLEREGISRERQQEMLQRYIEVMGKHDT